MGLWYAAGGCQSQGAGSLEDAVGAQRQVGCLPDHPHARHPGQILPGVKAEGLRAQPQQHAGLMRQEAL